MPKIKCVCENIINLSEIPSANQLLIISDLEFDKFEGKVDVEKIFKEMKIVAKCNNCGRLHIFWDGFNKPQTIYMPEKINWNA